MARIGDGNFFKKRMGTSLIGGEGKQNLLTLQGNNEHFNNAKKKNGIIQILNVYPIYF